MNQRSKGDLISLGESDHSIRKTLPILEEKPKRRVIGTFDGKVKIQFMDDCEMSDEELLGDA